MGIAYFTLGLIPHLSSVFLFVLLFSMSEVLVFPTIDNLVSDLADESLLSTYYGFVDMGWAIGATLGNLLGGIFIGFAQSHHLFVVLWIGYGCLSILALPLIFLMVSLNRIASKGRAQAKGEI
jgi:MFS family permease